MRILVLDDDKAICHVLSDFLSTQGHHVEVCHAGETAVEITQENPPDVALVDIKLPGISGIQTLKKLKSISPNTEVVMITGEGDISSAIEALEFGAFAYIRKPFDLYDLLSTVKKARERQIMRKKNIEYARKLERLVQSQSEELKREKYIKEMVFSHTLSAILVVDSDLRIVSINEAFKKMFGLNENEAHGMYICKAIGWHANKSKSNGNKSWQLPEQLRQVILHKLPIKHLEIQCTLPNKQIKYFHLQAFLLPEIAKSAPLLCILLDDITDATLIRIEKDRTHRELQCLYKISESISESREIQELVEITAQAIYDAMDKNYVRGVAVELDGWYAQYPDTSNLEIQKRALEVKINIDQTDRGEIRLWTRDPGYRPYRETSLCKEIAKRLAQTVETQERNIELYHSGQLASLGEMAAGVAHELNQPLSGIRTFAESVILGYKQGYLKVDEKILNKQYKIIKQCERMEKIINDLRVLSRDTSKEEMMPVNVVEVVESALQLLGTQLKVHGITVIKNYLQDKCMTLGHYNRLEQVVINLLTNARDTLDEKEEKIRNKEISVPENWYKKIEITVGISVKNDKRRVRFSVLDNGLGLNQDTIRDIFKPFYTNKPLGKGTGLGLSISRRIIQEHKGTIEVYPRVGEGCEFAVFLPELAETQNNHSG